MTENISTYFSITDRINVIFIQQQITWNESKHITSFSREHKIFFLNGISGFSKKIYLLLDFKGIHTN